MLPEIIDETTGEILESADGGRRHPAARSLADFFRMMEDGQFDADVAADLQELAGDLENMVLNGGNGRLTAELNLKVKIIREPDGFYILDPSYTIKRPKEKRRRSVAYLTDDNAFTPNMPRQGHLFGTVRDVTPARQVKN